MKVFAENTKGNEHIIMMSQAEARLLYEMIEKAAEQNKRKKSYKTMVKKLDELACF